MFGFFGKTFDPAGEVGDLSGKVILITGGNNGLGLGSIHHLAPKKPKIYLAARTRQKYDIAVDKIYQTTPNADIDYLELDLASLSSVKAAADSFLSSSSCLDVLMNNAGVANAPADLTEDGYELQFGTNHMGHALLTKLLLPIMLKTAEQLGSDVRIVNLSSNGHQFAPRGGFLPETCKTDMQEYYSTTRYGQSKLANILYTKGLAKHYPSITSVAVHPGAVNTNLFAGVWQRYPWAAMVLRPLQMTFMTPETGALTQVYVATGKGVQQGRYYVPTAQLGNESAYAKDEGLVDRLWEWTEEELKGKGYGYEIIESYAD